MNETILVVDDETRAGEELRRTLQKLGYRTPPVTPSSNAALRAVDEYRPDLLLIEIASRGTSDAIYTAALLRQKVSTPIVYVTSRADEETLARIKGTHPHGLLERPFAERELKTTLEVALNRRQLELQLAARERWFEATLESIGDAVIATDPGKRVTFLNPVAETMTGWRASEAAGRGVDEVLLLVEPGTDKTVSSTLGRAIHEELIAKAMKLELVARDGSRRVVDDSAAAILDSNGELLGGVVVLRDVSEQVKLEKRLSVTERLSSLGTLAAGVAHEINNPLSYILINLELSLQMLATDAPASADNIQAVRDMLTEAMDGTTRVTKIVDGMRRLAPADADAHDVLRIPDVLETAIRLTHNALTQRARLVSRLDETPVVRANESELVQVFTNLLINASQAIDEGHADRNEIRVLCFGDDQGRAVVEVRDSGRGIAADELYRVFDPFYSTRGPREGAGLGLAISQTIVTGYGGSLDVESVVGKGSVFRVTLPAALVETPIQTAIEIPVGAVKRGRILVVDDEPAIARGLQRILAPDHDVTVIADAEQAYALACERRFDVIFCDLMLRGVSGMDLHDRLTRIDPDAASRIVFMTGGAFTPRAEEFLRTTPNRTLVKPFQRAQVEAVVSSLLR